MLLPLQAAAVRRLTRSTENPERTKCHTRLGANRSYATTCATTSRTRHALHSDGAPHSSGVKVSKNANSSVRSRRTCSRASRLCISARRARNEQRGDASYPLGRAAPVQHAGSVMRAVDEDHETDLHSCLLIDMIAAYCDESLPRRRRRVAPLGPAAAPRVPAAKRVTRTDSRHSRSHFGAATNPDEHVALARHSLAASSCEADKLTA
jgi:hypothetical protein